MLGIYQATRTLLRRHFIFNLKRFIHNESSKLLIPLSDKKLLRVQGQDSQEFLQGLVTNDMRHFDEGARSVFAMFLNNKGRVLYDTLIHKGSDEHSFILECDKKVAESLRKHLNIYKLKRAVKIDDLDSILKVWALLSESGTPECSDVDDGSLVVYRDPRLLHLGSRLITDAHISPPQLLDMVSYQVKDVHLEDPDVYRYLRYKLGVGEGADDLPSGTCFPLEVNCDYLHGVSFHKGCYIGQELTARVHHTGVVRKRLMPIKFSSILKEVDLKNAVIQCGEDPAGKSNLGKLRGIAHNYGLGLVRIKEALDAKTLKIGDHIGEIVRPSWWPMEAPKELQSNKIDN